MFAKSLQKDEMLAENLAEEDILHRLYHSSGLVVSGEKKYEFSCRCNREKLLATLRSFPKEEIEQMLENNKITADCHFCSEKYVFDKGEIISH